MAAPDPVDLRLLSVIADTGRASVHEIAARLGMDVRDVAARLAALATTGLPIVVGVECDPHGIRNALASVGAWGNQPSGSYPVGPQQVAPQHGPQQAGPLPPGQSGHHSGPYNSGAYPGVPPHGAPSGPYPAPSGPYPAPGSAAQGYQPPPGPPASQPFTAQGPSPTFGSGPHPGPTAPGAPPANQQPPNTPVTTWGPPGSASWVRGEQPATVAPATRPASARSGKVGSKLDVDGLEGERISIQLVEVVDPADFLYTAAGYTLQDGERSAVVHTELTNRGSMSFTSLPDLYLVLVATDGSTIAKSTVQLSSRPPHRIGVPAGETAGGHTVFVLPENTELAAVRWTPRPGDEQRTLTWDITGL